MCEEERPVYTAGQQEHTCQLAKRGRPRPKASPRPALSSLIWRGGGACWGAGLAAASGRLCSTWAPTSCTSMRAPMPTAAEAKYHVCITFA